MKRVLCESVIAELPRCCNENKTRREKNGMTLNSKNTSVGTRELCERVTWSLRQGRRVRSFSATVSYRTHVYCARCHFVFNRAPLHNNTTHSKENSTAEYFILFPQSNTLCYLHMWLFNGFSNSLPEILHRFNSRAEKGLHGRIPQTEWRQMGMMRSGVHFVTLPCLSGYILGPYFIIASHSISNGGFSRR